MDRLIFNSVGYRTDSLLNKSAKKIQNAYKNYRDYQIKKRIDIIRNLIPDKKFNENPSEEEDKEGDEEVDEEKLYWIGLRNIIKYGHLDNYVFL